jgi:predicted alpha-1,6-mannanase (GH76 family)
MINVQKYTITIDVESSMDVDQLSKKIQRLDRIETFMIKYHKVQKVDKFDSNPYYDIVSDHVNEVP